MIKGKGHRRNNLRSWKKKRTKLFPSNSPKAIYKETASNCIQRRGPKLESFLSCPDFNPIYEMHRHKQHLSILSFYQAKKKQKIKIFVSYKIKYEKKETSTNHSNHISSNQQLRISKTYKCMENISSEINIKTEMDRRKKWVDWI